MALIVKLNPDTQLYGYEYYDQFTSTLLTGASATSNDLSGFTAAQLYYIYNAVNQNRLILVSGSFPSGTGTVGESGFAPSALGANTSGTSSGSSSVAVNPYTATAASGSNVLIHSGACMLLRVIVDAQGSGATVFYDNTNAAMGTIIGEIPAWTNAGTELNFGFQCSNGIYYQNSPTGPSITIEYQA